MFKKKTDKNKPVEVRENIVDPDLIVHNMPNQTRLAGSSPAPVYNQVYSNNLSIVREKNNKFKLVGALIIIGGLLLVSGLVYASYYFIIKPSIGKNVPAAGTQETSDKEKKAVPEIASSTNTDLNTLSIKASTTVVVSDIVTPPDQLASTTLAEELAGLSNNNLPPLVDIDQDGLYDEEELVFGLNAAATDSDGDKYSDLEELDNKYNPAGSGKLADNSNLTEYFNLTANYQVLYPKNWLAKSLNDGYTVVFTAPDSSLIQISVQNNTDRQTILSWYENSFFGTILTYDKLKGADTWEGLMGEDGLNFYLTDKKRASIYVISYIPAIDDRIAYPNVFKMMIDSLVIK